MRVMRVMSVAVVVAVGMVLSLSAFAQPGVIYRDAFDTGEAAALDGQPPQVRPGTETWSSETFIKEPSNGLVRTGGAERSAHLPMPSFGEIGDSEARVYTLTGRVFNDSTGDRWVALGWTSNNGNNRWNDGGHGTYWFFWRGNNELRAFRGAGAVTAIGGTGVNATGEAVNGRQTLDLRVIIDVPGNLVSFEYKNPSATEWSSYATSALHQSTLNGILNVGFSSNITTGGQSGLYSFELSTEPDPPAGTIVILK